MRIKSTHEKERANKKTKEGKRTEGAMGGERREEKRRGGQVQQKKIDTSNGSKDVDLNTLTSVCTSVGMLLYPASFGRDKTERQRERESDKRGGEGRKEGAVGGKKVRRKSTRNTHTHKHSKTRGSRAQRKKGKARGIIDP